MATPASGIWNHTPATAPAVHAMDSGSGSSGDTGSSDGATISANDFLSLLVTEMQNQDPTAATDPNEYINQLVNVNSLEQLISINQTLSGALGTSTTSGQSPAAGNHTFAATQSSTSSAHAAGSTPSVASKAAPAPASHSATTASGNLSVPRTSAAADRVAHALSGRIPHA